MADAYQSEIRPLMERYCHDCHGAADTVEGDINLAAMKNWDDAAKHPQTWQKVAEMLGNGLMPPEDAEQPTEAERAQLQKWVGDYLAIEARARAGDPGRVILRRLSNAEYTYTLRDLTGVESLDPAREFPADGAAGEGFTNTGSALVMSPALVTKYLDAAKEVASHAVLLPDGFRFSPHTTARDWTDDTLAQIRDFYSQFTDAGGGSQVNLQGIVFDTNQGGRLPVEKYLAATLDRTRCAGDRPQNNRRRGPRTWAECKVSGHPLGESHRNEPSLLLDDFRARWRNGKTGRCGGTGGRHRGLAEVVVELRERGADWPRGWAEAVDGARQPTDDEARVQIQDSGIARWRRRYDFTRSHRCGRRQRIRLRGLAGSRGWSRRAGRIYCCETFASVARTLASREPNCSRARPTYLNAADEVSSSDESRWMSPRSPASRR